METVKTSKHQNPDSVMTQISELPDMKFNVTMTNMLKAQM